MKRPASAAASVVALLLGLGIAGCGTDATAVDIGIRYSRFDPDTVRVSAGSTVTFTISNRDPIAHEFILGTADEHAEHERGTEQTHQGARGAASLEAGETETVTFTFGAPGTMEFACHLPGHYAYGMRGTVTVT